jgi:hypothetical protein
MHQVLRNVYQKLPCRQRTTYLQNLTHSNLSALSTMCPLCTATITLSRESSFRCRRREVVMVMHVGNTGRVFMVARSCPGLVVPGTSLFVRVLQAVQATSACRRGAGFGVPRASVLVRVLQAVQVPSFRSCCACVRAPRAALFVCVLQAGQIAMARRSRAGC